MSVAHRICTRCIMDTTDPDITFDREGVCNHCKAYAIKAAALLAPERTRERALQRLADRIRRAGKDQEYDCIAGVSGGVDSTFAVYRAKELGLRPLAVHVDNGWDSELAVRNIEQTMRKLGVDLYTYVLDWEEFKDLQIAFIKSSVVNWEIPTDHAYHAANLDVAAQQKIKFLIHGGNIVTEGIFPFAWGYVNRDLRLIEAIQRQFGRVKLEHFPRLSLRRYAYYRWIRGIRYVYLLNYLPYNKQKAIEVLQSELGWRYYGGKHYESIYTRFYQGYVLPRKFNIDKRRAHLSTLICSGQITREQALEEIGAEPYPAELAAADKDYVLKKLGLREEEFERLMAAPPRQEREYPSHYWLFRTLRLAKRSFDRASRFSRQTREALRGRARSRAAEANRASSGRP